jgi:hypothetical protein
LKYHILLSLREIWWSNSLPIFKCCSFLNTSVNLHLWQIKTIVFLQSCLICAILLCDFPWHFCQTILSELCQWNQASSSHFTKTFKKYFKKTFVTVMFPFQSNVMNHLAIQQEKPEHLRDYSLMR